jgi:putative flavoprotein involved in K+ transport
MLRINIEKGHKKRKDTMLEKEKDAGKKIHVHDTIVIGAGQAGLATGYYLQQQGRDFVIIDANERVGDSWRQRWDSLRLFTAARYNGMPGMAFPAPPYYFPTKDEMADFLAHYARHFDMPTLMGRRVRRLWRNGDGFRLDVAGNDGAQRFEARNVVVAMANYQQPHYPPFAAELHEGIMQLHSAHYRNPSQLQDGDVLIVGAGNSGSEIGMELVRERYRVWMAGRDTGQLPFRIDGSLAKRTFVPLVVRFLFHRIMTVDTPIGRKVRPKVLGKGGPLIRVKKDEMARAGIKRVGRVQGVRDGRPLLDDGRALDVTNVVWCTGFHPGFSWIDLPIHGEHEPRHDRGVARDEEGLYFVGLHFQSALSSAMIHGAGRDARHIVRQIAIRQEMPVAKGQMAMQMEEGLRVA